MPWTHVAHQVSSVAAGCFFLAASLLLVRRHRRGAAAWTLHLLALCWGLSTLASVLLPLPGGDPGLMGVAQRLSLLACSGWMVGLGVHWWRAAGGERRPQPC